MTTDVALNAPAGLREESRAENPTTTFDRLVGEIESVQRVIDARLTAPARWTGPTRKEFRYGQPCPDEARAVAQTFDSLRSADPWPPISARDLIGLNRSIGADGEFRTIGVSIGGFRDAAHHRDVPELAATALDRAQDGVEHPILAAARLHMELLLIHPFADGNGRTVRLASSWLLLRAGFRSTLLTAVEQHCRSRHQLYVDAFDQLRLSKPTDHDTWLVTNLGLMLASGRWAAWFREREDRLRSRLRAAGIRRGDVAPALLEFDLGRSSDNLVGKIAPAEVPLIDLHRAMPPEERAEMSHQIHRLLAEEAADGSRRGRRRR